ncbi:MAG: hypothetical protein ABR515_08775, partial [Nitrososphaeraceae archaeon]
MINPFIPSRFIPTLDLNSNRDIFLIFVVHSLINGRRRRRNYIKKAENEKREMGIAEHNPHNRKKDK